MRVWLFFGCLAITYVVVPVCVYWLRHRPHRLEQGTQHIVMAGLLVQFVMIALAGMVLWLL